MPSIFADVLRAVVKLLLGCLWLLLTCLWVYAIYKSIGQVHTESDAGELLTPNYADVYPVFLSVCALLLFLVMLDFRRVRWPWLKRN